MTRAPDCSDPDEFRPAEALALLRARLRQVSSDADVRRALVVLERATALTESPSIGQLERDVARLDARVQAIRACRDEFGAERDPEQSRDRARGSPISRSSC